MKAVLIAAGIAAWGIVVPAAHAQSFTTLYNYMGTDGTSLSQAVQSQPTGATFSTITRGPGLGANAANNCLNSNGFGSTFDTNDYYGFTITPSLGKTVSLSNLSYVFQRSGTGPTNFVIRSSVDGFTADLFTTTENSTSSGLSRTFNLSAITGLQNLSTATTIRIYAYGSTSTAGTFRLSSTSTTNGTSISGTVNNVTVVPEAGTLALIAPALGGIGVGVVRRRKNA